MVARANPSAIVEYKMFRDSIQTCALMSTLHTCSRYIAPYILHIILIPEAIIFQEILDIKSAVSSRSQLLFEIIEILEASRIIGPTIVKNYFQRLK